MHSGPFGCLTKLGAKSVELVQKCVPGSCVGIFHNERTRSTPLDPKLTFWCVSYYLDSGLFGCLLTLGAKQAELVQKFVPRSRFGIFATNASDPPHRTLKLPFWCVSYYLGVFGTVWLPFETRAKRAELVPKFVPRSRFGFFRIERTLSTPLDPKLTFWCGSYYLGAFGTVWLPYETRCKTGRTSAKSSSHEVASEFFATNASDPPHWTLN